MSNNVTSFTDQNFENDVLKSGQPVLVDFWAEWCGPCRQLGPIIEELASEYQGNIKFGKVNTDQNQGITIRYGVQSIPTVMVFQGGNIVERIVGARPKSEIKKVLDKYL